MSRLHFLSRETAACRYLFVYYVHVVVESPAIKQSEMLDSNVYIVRPLSKLLVANCNAMSKSM